MKKIFPNWILPLISLALFVAGLEIALAFFWPHKIVIHPYHEQYHPVLGWVNKPNVSGSVHITRSLSFHRTHNSHGLRSLREISYEKAKGVKRILLLGDSFFWGFGVDDEDIVSEALQRKLGAGTEVVNGSVTGYGTDQELLWLTEEGLKYKPDVVVLGFFPTNDIDEISRSIMYSYPKPYFELAGKRLIIHNVPVPDTRETRRKAFEAPDTVFGRVKQYLRYHTHTYPFLAGRLNAVPVFRRLFLDAGLAEEFTNRMPGIVEHQLQPERAQDLADALIMEMRRVANENKAQFLLVHIPRREKGSSEKEELVYGMQPRAWNEQVSTYLSSFTKSQGITYLDLLPIVRRHEIEGETLYNRSRFDHHWTRQGHAVAADALAEKLAQMR